MTTLYDITVYRGDNIKEFTKDVIKSDKTGELCYALARLCTVQDIDLIIDSIIEKDTVGRYTCAMASMVDGERFEKLRTATINAKDQDKFGAWRKDIAIQIRGRQAYVAKNHNQPPIKYKSCI